MFFIVYLLCTSIVCYFCSIQYYSNPSKKFFVLFSMQVGLFKLPHLHIHYKVTKSILSWRNLASTSKYQIHMKYILSYIQNINFGIYFQQNQCIWRNHRLYSLYFVYFCLKLFTLNTFVSRTREWGFFYWLPELCRCERWDCTVHNVVIICVGK